MYREIDILLKAAAKDYAVIKKESHEHWTIDDLREAPAITVSELLPKPGAEVTYNDPHCPYIGRGRKYDLQMKSSSLDELGQYDCALIITDHSAYDYHQIVEQSALVVDTRNATRHIQSDNIVHC